MTNRPTRYREIDVSGAPTQLGEQIGEAARDEIRGFAEIALKRVQRTVNVSRERALSIARQCIPFVEAYDSDMLDELRGVSAASGVSLEDLMLLQVRNQLTERPAEGCTAFSVASDGAESGFGTVAQNWDADPALDPFTVVLTRRPIGKPALMTITQAGLISYMGMNNAGIGTCVNTLPAPSRDVGVPHYFTLRGIYEATSLDKAVHAVSRAERAIPANIMMITPQGPADLEVTIDNVHVLRPNDRCVLVHTNHCVHPDLFAINDDFPELIESHPRLARIGNLIANGQPRINIEQMKTALSDHTGHPKSICRHENDHPTNGFWATVFSVIIEPAAGRMHVSRGNPCQSPFEIYELN